VIEDRAKEVVHRAEANWKKANRHSQIIRRLFGFQNRRDSPWKPFNKEPIQIRAALKSFLALDDNNHGIKEDNVCRLLFPIGIEYKQLDVVWLTNLESFGALRGSLAHSSIKTLQPIEPKAEFDKVANIMKGLRILDRKISRLK